MNNKKLWYCLLVCYASLCLALSEESGDATNKILTRAGLCSPGASPCTCIQRNKFVQFATASHGAPVHAVSWCCKPTLNNLGNPAIHLAIAGDASSGIPGDLSYTAVYIRIYELDLVTQQFFELNSSLINDQIQGAGTLSPEINALDWCCTDSAYFLIAGGKNLVYYPDSVVGPNIADVVVFAFDNASWQNSATTPIPFATDKTGYYYYTFGDTVYAVAALCSPCTDSTIQFYLAIGGKSTTNGVIAGSRKQISIVAFVLGS
jgi:hypothetical protein